MRSRNKHFCWHFHIVDFWGYGVAMFTYFFIFNYQGNMGKSTDTFHLWFRNMSANTSTHPLLCTFGEMKFLFLTCNTDLITTRPAAVTRPRLYCLREKLSGKQKHLSLLGRHKELRLTVRYTRPLPKLGWFDCWLLTAAHTMHTDACRRRDGFTEEENANFSVTVNDAKVVLVWMDHQLSPVRVISSPCN